MQIWFLSVYYILKSFEGLNSVRNYFLHDLDKHEDNFGGIKVSLKFSVTLLKEFFCFWPVFDICSESDKLGNFVSYLQSDS